MKKRSKKTSIQDFESEKQAKMALLSKIVDKMDDESLILTSCEIRMYLLDIIEF